MFHEALGTLALFLGSPPQRTRFGWYDEDFLDGSGGFAPSPVETVLAKASYSACYLDAATLAARSLGVVRASGSFLLCDHRCDAAPCALREDACFVGNFSYDVDARSAHWPAQLQSDLERQAGGRASVRVHRFGPSLEAIALEGGWPPEKLRALPLPLLFLKDATPSEAERCDASLRALGCETERLLEQPIAEEARSDLDALVLGARETAAGVGLPWLEVTSVATRASALLSPSSAAVLRAWPAESLREVAEALAHPESWRPASFGSTLETTRGERVVVDRRTRHTFVLAAFER